MNGRGTGDACLNLMTSCGDTLLFLGSGGGIRSVTLSRLSGSFVRSCCG